MYCQIWFFTGMKHNTKKMFFTRILSFTFLKKILHSNYMTFWVPGVFDPLFLTTIAMMIMARSTSTKAICAVAWVFVNGQTHFFDFFDDDDCVCCWCNPWLSRLLQWYLNPSKGKQRRNNEQGGFVHRCVKRVHSSPSFQQIEKLLFEIHHKERLIFDLVKNV